MFWGVIILCQNDSCGNKKTERIFGSNNKIDCNAINLFETPWQNDVVVIIGEIEIK